MKKPEYSKIHEFYKNNKKSGWNARRLLVNDEDFPHNGKLLIDWLLKKGLIRKWEQDRYNAGMHLRNSYSHLESISIMPPHSSMIKNEAKLDLYDTSATTEKAYVSSFMKTRIISISEMQTIQPVIDQAGNTVAQPALLYASDSKHDNMRFRVIGSEGFCFIKSKGRHSISRRFFNS